MATERPLREAHVRPRQRAKNRERHRETVIECRLDPAARRRIAALHVQIVAARFGLDTHGSQVARDQLEAVALLHAQLAHIAKHRLTHGAARHHRQDRDLVHERRNFGCGHHGAPQRCRRADEQIGHRLAAFVAQVHTLDVRAHALEHDQKSGAGRVHPYLFDQQLAALGEHGCRHQKCRRRGVSRHGKPERRDARVRRRLVHDRAVAQMEIEAEMHEHALSVVAREVGLAQRDTHLAREPREEQRALDLRARHRGGVGERPQRPAPDGERQRVGHFLFYFRPHRLERLGHPPHRPAPQRSVAGEARAERLPRQHAEQQPRGGAGIAAVEVPSRPAEFLGADRHHRALAHGADRRPRAAAARAPCSSRLRR